MRFRLSVLAFSIALLGAGCVPSPREQVRSTPRTAATPSREVPVSSFATKRIDLRSIPGVPDAFASVSVEVPSGWEAGVVSSLEAVNLYDPAAPGASPREQSQIFLRHFSANDFLTLSTVTIHEREQTTVVDRPAVRYVIEKRARVPNFPAQPSWRNIRHAVVDVRLVDANPSIFLVIGKRPDLLEDVFNRFLNSLEVQQQRSAEVVYPVRGFASAITKKPFGLFVRPGQSPVEPERFTGYHAAVDAELPADTPVFSIAAGTSLRSGRVSGYGGLVVIEHRVEGQRLVGVYGHLDPADLPPVGKRIDAGGRIGKLGGGFTHETDGERPHLHFGLYAGPGVDVRGYVPTEKDLALWRDPIHFLREKSAQEP
ncbi:MAG: hypothetical protein G01um1014106_99 [Parcubacteria group bacterium Gr01-1014_106]|nr:MAG: hypothetical protein G01um1014106_99 [Parcubacteria group bacterium Gr01-1014_106]